MSWTLLRALRAGVLTWALPWAGADALTLQINPSATSLSFWDPSNWSPALAPAAGDTVVLNSARVANTLYLGDASGIPAQNGAIARLHFNGPIGAVGGPWVVNWGSSPAGGSSGSLSFSGTDAADPGVGIRIGRTDGNASGNLVSFVGANNTPAQRMTIALGFANALPLASGGNALRLYAIDQNPANTVTLHANSVRLESNRASLQIGPNAVLDANSVTNAITPTRDTNVLVSGIRGKLKTSSASFLSTIGTAQVPLQIVDGGSVEVASNLQFAAQNDGVDSTVRVGGQIGPVPSPTAGSLSVAGTLAVSASSGATATVDVDGSSASASAGTLRLDATSGGTAELRVRRGASFSSPQVLLLGDAPRARTPGTVRIRVEDAGSSFSGDVDVTGAGAEMLFSNGARCQACDITAMGADLIRFDASHARSSRFDVASSAAVEFLNGTTVTSSELLVRSGGSATFDNGSDAELSSLRLDTSAATAVAAATVSSSEVLAGTVNLDSDLALLPYASGGELGGQQVARLQVINGGRVLIGDDPSHVSGVPLLAIGQMGEVGVDPLSAIHIADLHPAASTAGTITLGVGGSLYGTGTINGIGFAAGSHPIVVNAGGTLSPGFSPGALTIEGEYVQNDGVLVLEIGGTGAGEHDVLDATLGVSFLGGTIRFVQTSFGDLPVGTQLSFFGGRPTFIDPLAVTIEDYTGFGLDFDFATGIATVTIGSVPEPSIAALLAASALAFGVRRWRA